jgi:hypothetical protein
MSVAAEDIRFRKAKVISDASSNGGAKGLILINSGARHNLFPRVTRAERTAGITRYRKEFWCNENTLNEVAYSVLAYLEFPSNAGDRFYLGAGTQTDNQASLNTTDYVWKGIGSLQTALNGGETAVALTMENNDFQFPNGGYLHLSNKFMVSQTINSGVNVGDSVTYSVGNSRWEKITATTDIVYPNGLYVGSSKVMTVQSSSVEEWLKLKDTSYTETLATGNGSTTNPTLTALVHGTNICVQPNKRPVVTATCGGVTRTVNISAAGVASGYCSAGQLNMATGAWTTAITWTTAPDNATSVSVTYYENCYAYSGNVATVQLDDTVSQVYATSNSYGAGCVDCSDVLGSFSGDSKSSTSGTYNAITYPIVCPNVGSEEDTFTLTFSSATAFSASGVVAGSLGSGSINSAFSPTNPNTSTPYFTIPIAMWGGTWASGDTFTFTTHPSAFGLWLKEVVPAGVSQEPYNICALGWYCE